MLIHFICRGNVYRSRLAETYLKSKQLSNVDVISSGIEADKNLSGIISWYSQRIIQMQKIQDFEKQIWQKTSKELLDQADLNVFMNTDIYNYCIDNLGFNKDKYQVWEIEDLIDVWDVTEVVNKTDNTFSQIKSKVDELANKLS